MNKIDKHTLEQLAKPASNLEEVRIKKILLRELLENASYDFSIGFFLGVFLFAGLIFGLYYFNIIGFVK